MILIFGFDNFFKFVNHKFNEKLKNGVYISPKAINLEKNNKYIKQMETILGPDTKLEILEIKSYKREIYLKVV